MSKVTTLSLLLCALSAAAGAQTTYHVAKTGNDTNAGTAAKPWKTIQHGVDTAASGDTVLVHTGNYSEQITLKRSITLSNAPGEKPIIDGAKLTANDDGLVGIRNLSHVAVRGFTIRNYKTTNSNIAPIAIFVQGQGDDIQLRDNTITRIQNTGSNAANINALGIAVYGNGTTGPITNLVIDGNEIYGTKTGNSETLTVNGNVDGFQVTNNNIHNVNNIGIDCIGFEKTSKIAGQDFARNGLVAGNTVSHVTSATNPAYHGDRSADGIYVDGGADIIIERNIVDHADIGIEVASEHGSKNSERITVRNNLIYASNIVGLSIGGYAKSKGGTKDCVIVNNTLYQNDTARSGSGEFQIQFNTVGNTFNNNILVASTQGVLISNAGGAGIPIGVSSDYNLYYAASNAEWNWLGHAYSTLATFATGSGGDAHSLFTTPGFVSPGTLNFRLAPGSAGINAGLTLSAAIRGTLDLAGNLRVQGAAIDIGFYETGA
ncbi:right-handed parallel beta-helix repeat-containing protein [soil metagenome]